MMYQEYNLKISYTRVVDKTFLPYAENVIKSMTGNSNFPDSATLLQDLVAAFNIYRASIPSTQARSQLNTTIKDTNRDVVKQKLRNLGFHVQMVAENDYEKLKSSGYPIAKKSSSTSDLPMPVIEGFTTNGTPQELTVKCKPSKAATLYDVRISTDKINWLYKNTETKSKVPVTNLPVDVPLFVQARLRNSEYQTPWSASVETRIFDSSIALPTAN